MQSQNLYKLHLSKVSENRNELNNKLSLLGITTTAVGFVPGKATIIADYAIKILGFALST
ncbi:hypothetical protein L1276_003020 [Flavobacterium sp. HSC-32F16]|nr:hypothetical protein [Flavobacterium sp. HSC-32F16]